MNLSTPKKVLNRKSLSVLTKKAWTTITNPSTPSKDYFEDGVISHPESLQLECDKVLNILQEYSSVVPLIAFSTCKAIVVVSLNGLIGSGIIMSRLTSSSWSSPSAILMQVETPARQTAVLILRTAKVRDVFKQSTVNIPELELSEGPSKSPSPSTLLLGSIETSSQIWIYSDGAFESGTIITRSDENTRNYGEVTATEILDGTVSFPPFASDLAAYLTQISSASHTSPNATRTRRHSYAPRKLSIEPEDDEDRGERERLKEQLKAFGIFDPNINSTMRKQDPHLVGPFQEKAGSYPDSAPSSARPRLNSVTWFEYDEICLESEVEEEEKENKQNEKESEKAPVQILFTDQYTAKRQAEGTTVLVEDAMTKINRDLEEEKEYLNKRENEKVLGKMTIDIKESIPFLRQELVTCPIEQEITNDVASQTEKRNKKDYFDNRVTEKQEDVLQVLQNPTRLINSTSNLSKPGSSKELDTSFNHPDEISPKDISVQDVIDQNKRKDRSQTSDIKEDDSELNPPVDYSELLVAALSDIGATSDSVSEKIH